MPFDIEQTIPGESVKYNGIFGYFRYTGRQLYADVIPTLLTTENPTLYTRHMRTFIEDDPGGVLSPSTCLDHISLMQWHLTTAVSVKPDGETSGRIGILVLGTDVPCVLFTYDLLVNQKAGRSAYMQERRVMDGTQEQAIDRLVRYHSQLENHILLPSQFPRPEPVEISDLVP